MKSIYYGISPSKEQLSYRHVYLDKNPALESPLNAVYDIDSYYGITDTLAFTVLAFALDCPVILAFGISGISLCDEERLAGLLCHHLTAADLQPQSARC